VASEALRRGGCAFLVALACAAPGCRGTERRAQDALETDSSVAASAAMLAAARRDGKVSRAFARTACDALYRQAEAARASVAGTPADRADARLADATARLDRTAAAVAALAKAVDQGDAR
jgi:hypothetical protein